MQTFSNFEVDMQNRRLIRKSKVTIRDTTAHAW